MGSVSIRDSINLTILQTPDTGSYIYANINKPVVGYYSASTIAVFNATWATAPSFLPPTSVDNFTFFANGQNIESSSIVSFTEESGSSILVIDPVALSYTFDESDVILAVGKFN